MKFSILYNSSHKNLLYYFSGSFYLAGSQIFSMILSFIGVYIFTNYSSKELYGSYAYIKSIALLANGFVAPGVANAVTYSVAKGADGALWEGIKVRWKRSWIAAIFLLAIATYAWLIKNNKELACAFIFELILFPFIYCTDLFNGYLQGKKEFKLYSLINITSAFFGSVVASSIIIFFKSIIIVVLWNAFIVSLFNCLVLYYVVKKVVKNNIIDEYFFPLSRKWTTLSILGTFASQSDRIVIGSFSNLGSLAAFNLAKSLASPIRNLGVILNKLLFPKLSAMNYSRALDFLFKKMVLFIILFITFGLILWLIAPLIIDFLFGAYKDSIWMLQISFIINVAISINIIISTLFTSQELFHNIYFKLNYFSTLLQTAITIIAGSIWEAQGILVALLIFSLASVLFNISLVVYFKKIAKYSGYA